MGIKKNLQQSLSLQFVGLMVRVLLVIVIGAVIITFGYRQISNYHANQHEILVQKKSIIQQIDDGFNQVFFDIRGYFAFGNETLRANGHAQEEKLRVLAVSFEELANTPEDVAFLERVSDYHTNYFEEIVPEMMTNFEQGDIEEVQRMANQGVTERLSSFRSEIRDYRYQIDDQIESNYQLLVSRNGYALIAVGIYLVTIILILFSMIRTMFKRVGQPLSEFAKIANEIAAGKEVELNLISNREDELGKLSVAFKKMVISLQDKEQDLVAHNEELMAQQDELGVQQVELERALANLTQSENYLKHRNQLVEGISNSLDKQKVLDEIIVNICKVTGADRGIITFLKEDAYASYGISKAGEKQFMEHLDNGLHAKLLTSKEVFSVKRELEQAEKGFHEEICNCHDLFIPILSAENEVVAIMTLSRFGSAFPTERLEEYQGFAKQIAISLEKIKMYDQTEEDRKRNQDILNTVLEGIQLVDLDGKTIQVNEKLSNIFDWNVLTQNVVGTSIDQWAEEMETYIEEKDEFMLFFFKAIKADDLDDAFTYRIKNTNKVYKVYANSLFRDEDKIGTVFVHREITKEAEVDKMKSEFVSTVSHELRTPLASIFGYTELMLNRELKPEKQKKYLTTIYQETKRLTSLINDFLDVQRMEAGKQSYEKKYLDLLTIVEKVVDSQKINTTEHQFKIIVDTPFTTVLGDKDKLKQVFTNLINNAIKYSPSGGKILIRLYQEGRYIKAAVQDEGLGIPADAIDNLFSKFYRVDNSDRRTIGGTGLGLSIVKEICHAHDGDVRVSSQYGDGSTFTIEMPLIETITNPTNPTKKTGTDDGYNVFIIEDDRSLAGLIAQELQDNKFVVYSFTKALKALEQLAFGIPAAIVLDLNLEEGEMDGWAFMRELKSMEQPYRDIPIVISSALEEQDKSLALGASDYLVKPYKTGDLSRTLLQTLLKKEKNGQIFIQDVMKEE